MHSTNNFGELVASALKFGDIIKVVEIKEKRINLSKLETFFFTKEAIIVIYRRFLNLLYLESIWNYV